MTKDGIQEVLSKDTQEKLLDFFENGSLPPDVESDDPFYKQAIHDTRIRPVSLDHKTAVKLVWLINARVNWPQFLHTKTVTDAIANEFSYQELKDINQALVNYELGLCLPTLQMSKEEIEDFRSKVFDVGRWVFDETMPACIRELSTYDPAK